MTRISSYLLMGLLIALAGCGKKTPPPPPPAAPEPPVVVQPPTTDKDKVVAKDREPTGNPTKDPPAKGTYTRDQFRALVGKNKDEVLRRLGPPESMGADGADEYWYYSERTTNDDGTLDDRANLTLQNGIVKRVYFKPRD